METHFWADTKKLPWLQKLVMRYDGRFLGNPIWCGNHSRVSLSFADIDKANKFHTMLSIIEQPFF